MYLPASEALGRGCHDSATFYQLVAEHRGRLVDLASGTYTVEFCWFDYDTDQVECQVEEIVIP